METVFKYRVDNFYRYLNLLKKADFGLSIRKSAIINYLKIKRGKFTDVVGKKTTCPAIVQMYSSRRCNLKCSFCELGYNGSPVNWEIYELTPSIFRKILSLDIVKKALVICFTGGEPLLNSDMPELMKIAKSNKYIIGLITNGLLLNERLEEIKNIGIADIQLSVYENTKEKLKNILPDVSKFFPLNASYVLPKSQLINGKDTNFANLIDTIKMCMLSGCASFKFNICHPNGSNKDGAETIYDNDFVYNSFIEICKNKLVDVNLTGWGFKRNIFPCKKFTIHFPAPLSNDKSVRNCTQPWTLFPISGNGDCSLCCGSGGLGNIFVDENIINNEKAKRIRKCMLNHNLPLENECINCIFRKGAYSSNF